MTATKHDLVARNMRDLAQVNIRMPRELWMAVRKRALDRGESAQAWMVRAVGVCVAVAGSGGSRGGVTAGAVEPPGDPASDSSAGVGRREFHYETGPESDQRRGRR